MSDQVADTQSLGMEFRLFLAIVSIPTLINQRIDFLVYNISLDITGYWKRIL
jgi:hypothetical protein